MISCFFRFHSTMAKMATRYDPFEVEGLRNSVDGISSAANLEITAECPQNPPQSDREQKINNN